MPIEAWEDDQCLFCVAAPHEPCEMYTTLTVGDRSDVPLPESIADHLVEVPVCFEHYQAFERYQRADSVADVRRP